MVTPAAKREAVAHLRISFEVSERRACKVLEADRTSVRYRGRRADDAIVRARLRELAAIRRRFGYRRLLVLSTRPTKTALFDAGYSAKRVTLSVALRSSGDACRGFERG